MIKDPPGARAQEYTRIVYIVDDDYPLISHGLFVVSQLLSMYVVLLLLLLVFLTAMKIPRKHTQVRAIADRESMFCQRMMMMKMNSLIIDEVLSPLYRRQHYSDGMYLISMCDVLLKCVLKLRWIFMTIALAGRRGGGGRSFHLFILAILIVSTTLHSTRLTPILIDLSAL